MIVELQVENLAIIERAQVAFGPGFTVLTGETGAGKSLMIDALELALGERADTELVRTGTKKATVRLAIDLSHRSDLHPIFEEAGIDLEGGLITIHREVLAEGKSTCRINGVPTAVGTLKKLGAVLVDLHGQHRHQSLLDPLTHVEYLDRWIGGDVERLKGIVADRWEAYAALDSKLRALQRGIRDREQRLDLLKFQINEIESVHPAPGEVADLENRLARLKNVERLSSDVTLALEALIEGETNAYDLSASADRHLSDALRLDSSLSEASEQLQTALAAVDEAGRALSRYRASLESDPELLDETVQRIDAVKRLLRKYGDSEVAVLDHLEKAKEEFATLSDAEESLDSLSTAREAAFRTLQAACADLTELRKSVAGKFIEDVRRHLKEMAMDKAELDVLFRVVEPTAAGADDLEFQFSANPGEALKPLAKIASGGEVSRVMLALKSALAGRAGTPTLIFDEVDTGLGGRAAATMGKKLADLAEHYQVIVISHLPQVASQAAEHLRLEKRLREGRVSTDVVRLSQEDRVDEIARMLAGDAVTDGALSNAREMLRFL